MVEAKATNPVPAAIRRSAISFAIAAVLIVGPSGSLADPVGWAAWAVIAASSTLVTIDLARRDTALLARRLSGGPTAERTRRQKAIQAVAGVVLIAGVIVAGLDRRFGWSSPPLAAIVAGDLALAASQLGFLAVFRANSFAGATVTVEADQRLISTGPYALVRHPMYAAMLPFLIGLGPALGSWWALLAAPAVIAALIARLLDEERLLARDLPGYAAYRETVRFRLVPGVW